MAGPLMEELKAGASLLREPYSQPAAQQLLQHLVAASPLWKARQQDSRDLVRSSKRGPTQYTLQVLQLMDRYMDWLLPACDSTSSSTTTTSTTDSSNTTSDDDHNERSNSTTSSNSSAMESSLNQRSNSNSSADGSIEVSVHLACMVYCVDCCRHQLTGVITAGEQAAASIRHHLVDGTAGTLALLARTGDVVSAAPADYAALVLLLCDAWSGATIIAYPLAGPTSCCTTAWSQVPALRQGLPAVAAALHWHLQQPNQPKKNGNMMGFLMQQLELLVNGVAASARGQPLQPSTTQQQQQQQQQHKKKLKHEKKQSKQPAHRGAAAAAGGPTGTAGWELHLPRAARQQMEGFLWGALGTAAAALQDHINKPPGHTANSTSNSPTTASSSTVATTTSASSSSADATMSTSSSSSSSSSSSPPSWAPEGEGYRALRLTQPQAVEICSSAAAALLQLASAEVPQQQQLVLVSAAAGQAQLKVAASGAGYLRQLIASALAERLNPGAFAPSSSSSSSSSSSNNKCKGPAQGSSSSSSGSSGGGGGDGSCSSGGGVGGQGAGLAPSSPAGRQASPLQQPQPEQSTVALNINKSEATAGFMCWPVTPTDTQNHSNTAVRLQQLTAAAAATWGQVVAGPLCWVGAMQLMQAVQTHGMDFYSDARARLDTLTQLLLLLTQQLQGVPPQLRADFLHSPAGGILLHVLSGMSTAPTQDRMPLEMLLQETSPAAAAGQQAAAGAWGDRLVYPQYVVQAMLLPALLLEHVPPGSACAAAAARGSSRSSSSSCGDACAAGRLLHASGGLATSNSRYGKDRGSIHASAGDHSISGAPASSHVVAHVKGALAPLVLVPHGRLQLPPGCVPPPAAFFLTEQLLRGGRAPAAALSLSIQLLRGGVSLLTPAVDHLQSDSPNLQQQQLCQNLQEQQQQQQGASNGGDNRPQVVDAGAAAAELARLAYCSLARSVVQVVILLQEHVEKDLVGQLLALAIELAQAAHTDPILSSCSDYDSSGGGIAIHGGCGAGGNISTDGNSSGSSNNMGSSSDACSARGAASASSSSARWGVAASLAAAVAATAYAAHLGHVQAACAGDKDQQQQAAGAASQAQQQPQDRSRAGEELEDSDTNAQAAAAGSGNTTTSNNTNSYGAAEGDSRHTSSAASAAAAGRDLPAGGDTQQARRCHASCSCCSCAAWVLCALRCLKVGGVLPRFRQDPLTCGGALLREAIRTDGATVHTLMRNALLALAARHPVPGMCGNVTCGRLEGAAAVGAVQGRVGSVCGGCRAAWYCCEGCQRWSWPFHRRACRGGS